MLKLRTFIFGLCALGAATDSLPAPAAVACVGDGRVDDTACLQSLIDAGGRIVLPRDRVFRISKTLIIGAGKTLNGSGSTIQVATRTNVLQINGNDVTVRNVKLNSVSTQPTLNHVALIFASKVSNILLYNNEISGNFGIGIMIGGSGQSGIRIVQNTIDPGAGRIGYGILVNALDLGDDPDEYQHDIAIMANTVKNVGGDAIEINSPVGTRTAPGATVRKIVIQNNTLSAPHATQTVAGFCLGIAGAADVQVIGNHMSECKWQGIHIEDHATRITILRNMIDGTIGDVGSETAWRDYCSGIFSLNSSHIKILGNTINKANGKGIEMGWNPLGMNSDVTIAGNVITRSGAAGILFAGSPGADVRSVIGPAEGYPANKVSGSATVDIQACVKVGGADAKLAFCGSKR